MYDRNNITNHLSNLKNLEERAIKTYEELNSLIKDSQHKKTLEEIIADEKKHKRLLEEALDLMSTK